MLDFIIIGGLVFVALLVLVIAGLRQAERDLAEKMKAAREASEAAAEETRKFREDLIRAVGK